MLMEITCEAFTPEGKSFQTHQNLLIPHYRTEFLLYPHNQSYNEQNLEIIQHSDTSNMIQKDLYTSYDKSDFDDNVCDDDRFCNTDDDQAIMPDNEIYKSANLNDNLYHVPRSKSDSELLPY